MDIEQIFNQGGLNKVNTSEKKSPAIRLSYLDNIRSLVIVFVVLMHSAVTYSGFGSWYYVEGSPEKLSVFEIVFFGFLQSFLQAWTMGILFFIAGFFASRALEKHGSSSFIKERAFRLGIPLLIYVFIITPLIGFIMNNFGHGIGLPNSYFQYLTSMMWLGATGPLWFVEALLIFCLIYVLLGKKFLIQIKLDGIASKNIVAVILLTAAAAFLIRLVSPVGTSFLNLQFPYFASYIVLFICGVLIGENKLLDKITDEKNIRWLKLSLLVGLPLWCFTMVFGGALEGETYFNGGFYWQSLAFALWESLTAIGFSLGIIALFRRKFNFSNKVTCFFTDNAFGVYFFHAPVLVAASLLFKGIDLDQIPKCVAMVIITTIVSLAISFLIRKIKPIGILLK